MQQLDLVPPSLFYNSLNTVIYRAGTSKLSVFILTLVPIYFIYEEEKQKNTSQSRLFSSQNFVLSKYHSLKFADFILEGNKTGGLLSIFAQPEHRKNADVPDVCLILLDAASTYPNLVLNQRAKTKERGSCVSFKIQTSEAAKIKHTK